MSNLTEQSEVINLAVGDYVVFLDEDEFKPIMMIVKEEIDEAGLVRCMSIESNLHAHLPASEIRKATAEEKIAGRRFAANLKEVTEAHIENHVSPHCQIDGMSASEYVRTNTLHQIEIARLNATIERLKTEKLAMQVELDALREVVI